MRQRPLDRLPLLLLVLAAVLAAASGTSFLHAKSAASVPNFSSRDSSTSSTSSTSSSTSLSGGICLDDDKATTMGAANSKKASGYTSLQNPYVNKVGREGYIACMSMYGTRGRDPTRGDLIQSVNLDLGANGVKSCMSTHIRALFPQGLALSEAERDELGVRGLLPAGQVSQVSVVDRTVLDIDWYWSIGSFRCMSVRMRSNGPILAVWQSKQEVQLETALKQIRERPTPMDKYLFLDMLRVSLGLCMLQSTRCMLKTRCSHNTHTHLPSRPSTNQTQDSNADLFFALLVQHTEELLPIVYSR